MRLFGTDGVRGKAGEFLSAQVAMRIAMAAGIYFKKSASSNIILLGKDTRRSGYMIESAIVAGLTSIGFNVRQIGPMPTPAIAFLTEDMRCDAGIMISASHNPYYDNGIKFFDKYGFKLDENQEKIIEQIYFDEDIISSNAKSCMQIGASKRVDDVIGRYIVHIKNSFPKSQTLRGLRMVLDVANGASYKVAPTIFSELGAEIFVLHDEPNGENINKNCGAMDPLALMKKVKELRADVGFAFDGDADRLVVVDENGEIIDGDVLIGVLATYLQENNMLKNNKIVATKMSNMALEMYLKTKNLELLRSDIGDKFVLEKMKNVGSNFGGEQSGHIIFGDFAKTGDGITGALQFSACMLQSKKSASKLASTFKPFPQILYNLKIQNKIPFEQIKGLQEFEESIKSKNLRPLFRYSGTENLIRLLIEGEDYELVQKSISLAKDFFSKALNG